MKKNACSSWLSDRSIVLLVLSLAQAPTSCHGFFQPLFSPLLLQSSNNACMPVIPNRNCRLRNVGNQAEEQGQVEQSFENSDDNDYYIPPPPQKRGAPQGGDMAYVQINIQRQMDTYAAIRRVGGLDCVRDVYVSRKNENENQTDSPRITTLWYVGKLAFAGVAIRDAISRQTNLIQEHAARLRPIELGRCFGTLQIYVAPGDSEVLVQNNEQHLDHVTAWEEEDGEPFHDVLAPRISLKECGFLCEVVTNMGSGFCVERAPDGSVMLEDK